MTEKELEKLIEDKYGAYPDDRPGVASKEQFLSENAWNKYCKKAIELMSLPKRDFLDRFPLLPISCGASLPLDE